MNHRVSTVQKRVFYVCIVVILLYGLCGCTSSRELSVEIETEGSQEYIMENEEGNNEPEKDMEIHKTEVEEKQTEPESHDNFNVKWEKNDDPTREGNPLRQELLSGNFEHLSGEYSDYRELFEMDWERGESEWRQIDLNGDGVEDFIFLFVDRQGN